MTLRTDLLPVVDAARAIGDTLGLYSVDVSVRVRTYSAAINTTGATLTNTTTTPLSPRPKVRKIAEGQGSYLGGGTLDASNGKLLADELAIGPITPDHATGGYTLAELVPASSPTTRVDLLVGGVSYEVFEVDDSKPFRLELKARRTK